MSERIVVDVGNTRVKFGRCASHQVIDSASLPHNLSDWALQLAQWSVTAPSDIVIAGVVPKTIEQMALTASSLGHRYRVIASHNDVPLRVDVDEPESVGIDRLLGALAAHELFPKQQLLVIDAGSAITANLLDASGTFRGGAILPGLGLMARTLHERTAKLPLVDVTGPTEFPGRSTASAIRSGIHAAACGAIEWLAARTKADRLVFTGGDGQWLESQVSFPSKHFAQRLVLEGIRLAAEAKP